MITVVEEAMALGLTEQKACEAMGISVRRFQDWRQRAQSGEYERRSKSPLTRPFNALTPAETEAIESAVSCAAWADLSCRELSIKIMERDGLYISHVAIWEYEKRHGLAGHRGKRRLMGRHRGEAPDTSFLNGPNQLWDWDFTKLPTGQPHHFWYLCAVIDQYSRKVVGWQIGNHADARLAKATWDAALIAERLTVENAPKSLSDRGTQMRAHSTREFFRDLGIAQLFARPRTPNDNPFIESFFATVKTHPNYPDAFPWQKTAIEYFVKFFHWYNEEHLHTRIGMVTPHQKHNGEWRRIMAERKVIKQRTFTMRRQFNKSLEQSNKVQECAIS